MKFQNLNRSMRVPFIVYADFESLIKPLDTCEPNPEIGYMKKYQEHKPSSFCYYIKCFDDRFFFPSKPVIYTLKSEDEDVAQKFVDMLGEDIKFIHKMLKNRKNNT